MKKQNPSTYKQTQEILNLAVKKALVRPVVEIVKPK